MILKKIKTEHTDKKTGMVLKRITTSEWETHNHKIAVNNSLFNCEKSRIENQKPILPAHFQVYHIFFNKKKKIWNFDRVAESKAHSSRVGRFMHWCLVKDEVYFSNGCLKEISNFITKLYSKKSEKEVEND